MRTSANTHSEIKMSSKQTNVLGARSGPLTDLKVIELAGIGPGPLCATLLADMGADVLRIDRNQPSGLGISAKTSTDLLRRGRRSVSVDLKSEAGVETVLELVEVADAIVEPFRPGVAERLGLGPDVCLARNSRLVYGRMTGWGQDGPYAQAAGHDLNYLAITGVLHAIGTKETPVPPLNVVADMGGGAMFMAFGLMAGLLNARATGQGQVIDAAMSEGSGYLAMANFGWLAEGFWKTERQSNFLDGAAHFYRCYATKDGEHVSIAAIEPKFYAILLERLGVNPEGLPAQMDRDSWAGMGDRFAESFKQKTRDEWCEVMDGHDACFAPVLSFAEAHEHPHAQARSSFVEVEGVWQPAPAPRFSATPPAISASPAEVGSDTESALRDWGLSGDRVAALVASGAVGWKYG